jgi:hypothetical protein
MLRLRLMLRLFHKLQRGTLDVLSMALGGAIGGAIGWLFARH